MTIKVLFAVTLLNLALLVLVMAQLGPIAVSNATSVLRGRALEITDAQGRVRASIVVHGPVATPGGAMSAETVVLRLIDPNGRPSVKIAGSETAAGLSFVGESDATQIILKAEGAASALKLATKDGRQQLISP